MINKFKMNKDELIKRLDELKEETTKAGFEYMHTLTPFPLDQFAIIAGPFIKIERAFTKAIKQLQKQSPDVNK